MPTSTLTPRQAAFVQEYLIDLNGTQAAIRAGYQERSAKVTASQILTYPNVQAAIAAAQRQRLVRTQITTDLVLQGLLAEATYFGEDTSHSARVAAWTQLGKHLKLFTDVVETKGVQDELFLEILHALKERRAAQQSLSPVPREISNGHTAP